MFKNRGGGGGGGSKAAKALVRLHKCTDLTETLLLSAEISTEILCTCSNKTFIMAWKSYEA